MATEKTINISNAEKIPGWMTSDELEWLATASSTHKCIVEIGCWKGRSTRALAENTLGRVYAVDTWPQTIWYAEDEFKNKPKDWLLNEFKKNVSGLTNIQIIRMPSVEAAKYIYRHFDKSFDMIFIDGGHDYDCIKADLLVWKPLLSPGGLLCGHDIIAPGVLKALQELIPDYVRGPWSIWYKEL